MGDSATRSLARNYSWTMLGSLIAGPLNFIAAIYLARVLGPASFGLFSFAQAFLTYLILLVDNGLSMFGVKEIAANRAGAGPLAANLLSLRLFVSVLVYFFALLVLRFCPLAPEQFWLFALTFAYIFYRAANVEWFFQGVERMGFNAFSRIIYAAGSLGLILIFVRGGSDLLAAPLIQAVVGLAVSLLMVLLLNLRVLRLPFASVDAKSWLNYLKRAWPLGASVIMIQIYYNLDTIMLGFMDEASVVGIYTAAYKILMVMISAFAVWQSSALPIMSRRYATDLEGARRFHRKFFLITMLVVVPATIVVFLAAPLIINLVFGSGYEQAALALRILVCGLVVMVIGSTNGVMILIPAGRYSQFLISVVCGAVLNVILNFILIPPFSFVGAAVATVITECGAAAVTVYFARQVFRQKT